MVVDRCYQVRHSEDSSRTHEAVASSIYKTVIGLISPLPGDVRVLMLLGSKDTNAAMIMEWRSIQKAKFDGHQQDSGIVGLWVTARRQCTPVYVGSIVSRTPSWGRKSHPAQNAPCWDDTLCSQPVT